MLRKLQIVVSCGATLFAGEVMAQERTAEDLAETLGQQRSIVVKSRPAEQSSQPGGTANVVPMALPEEIQINFQINFDYDSAALKPSEQAKLVPMCEAIGISEIETLLVVGHTDSSGSDAYNLQLSQLRAEEVARYLVEKCEVDPSMLRTIGRGEEAPLNPNNPRADENRRVEFQALS